jgi:hypothetical protein
VPKNIDGFRPGDVFGGNGFDAVYFRRQKVPESRLTDFDFLSLDKKEYVENNIALGMEKWLVLLFERETGNEPEPNQVIYYNVLLGDPMSFVKNQIKAKSEGMIVKSCKSGYDMMHKIMENVPEIQRNRLGLDHRSFLKNYGDR